MNNLPFTKAKKLLNIDNNYKTVKGQKYGYKTAILYLAPSINSGFNVCPQASQHVYIRVAMVDLIMLNKGVSIKQGGTYKKGKVF